MPCTVIEVGPCVVTQVKTVEKDGYAAVQVGFQDKKEKHTTKQMMGHFKKAGTTPKRHLAEFTYDEANATLKECYTRYVTAIYYANLVISNFTNENHDGVEPKFTSDYTKQCVAEARVMRAYLHMMMAILWNCPAILDHLLQPDELPLQAGKEAG